jgi:hypothetical protein
MSMSDSVEGLFRVAHEASRGRLPANALHLARVLFLTEAESDPRWTADLVRHYFRQAEPNAPERGFWFRGVEIKPPDFIHPFEKR